MLGRKDIKTKANILKYNGFSKDIMINKASIFYGETNTGKSFLLNECLKSLRKEFLLLIAYSSTATTDEMFPLDEYTSRALIYETLNLDKLNEIVVAAEERTKLYRLCRSEKNLHKAMLVLIDIYKMNNANAELRQLQGIYRIIEKIEKEKNEVSNKRDLKEIEKKCVLVYRFMMSLGLRYIKRNKIDMTKYDKMSITPILFVRLNPRICIIFNDFGEEIKALKTSEKVTFQNLFTRGRHANITTIILAQNTGQVDKKIRGQAHVNVFTTSESVNAWLKVSDADSFLKKKFKDAIENILIPDEKKPAEKREYPKLLYSREKGLFYVTANAMGKQYLVGDKRILRMIKSKETKKIDEIDDGIFDEMMS